MCVYQVLATMVEEAQATQLSPAIKSIAMSVWQLIADALAAGAATLSMTAAAAASQPVSVAHLVTQLPCTVCLHLSCIEIDG